MSAPDTRTEAERLREAVARAAWHSGSGVRPSSLLRAVVETLGLSWESVDTMLWMADTSPDKHLAEGVRMLANDFVSTLLTAAEVPND